MRFFIPNAVSGKDDEAYHQIKKQCQVYVNSKISDARVYSVDIKREDGIIYTARVGELFKLTNDIVYAIFFIIADSIEDIWLNKGLILIATETRGVKGGQPVQISSKTVSNTIYFDL